MTADELRRKSSSTTSSVEEQSDDYFDMIKNLLKKDQTSEEERRKSIDGYYAKVLEEIIKNNGKPSSEVKFGTSGWRGILGKDVFCKSVAQVTMAIVEMYRSLKVHSPLADALGVSDLKEAQQRGGVVGFDNRFGGEVLARSVVDVLAQAGIKIYYAGETTTGVISAAVLQLNAAFSINLTPSHNPLEYGGFKFNAADGGPAAAEITRCITTTAKKIIEADKFSPSLAAQKMPLEEMSSRIEKIESLELWKKLVISNQKLHGLEYDRIIRKFDANDELVVAIDSVHGASRLHIRNLFNGSDSDRLIHIRNEDDVTFGGVAPEPSSENLQKVIAELTMRPERLKLGAIIDPDGDRIRFTDGNVEIGMNQFGAMAYHFLHELKGKRGMVAKTVATSNFANGLAKAFGEEIFEPKVGFKEFKPVIGKALVYFEESDGISIIGHTPEKDAYIGLLLALDIVLSTGKNLGDYLKEMEGLYGYYYPERDGVEVSLQGHDLLKALSGLEKYTDGVAIEIGNEQKVIVEVIEIDGRKMIFEDGSWLMIRPSGTEPKVRFYVESRTIEGTKHLVQTAKNMLGEVGLL